ncbi:pyrimidine/purine nucleoside phosphorylase [Alteromonas sp. A079]|uniref:pyrimidine/purine nucleoside phosphorylase n=1 Tax=Alteromonas sp. A079 TaxID=3410268 RepID=UPI003B9FD79D
MAFSVNHYFDNKVTSISFEAEAGPCTSGVMAPGEYTFDTSKHELMKVVEGELVVRLPGSEQWQSFPAGTSFTVDANVSFDVKVNVASAYLCFYS